MAQLQNRNTNRKTVKSDNGDPRKVMSPKARCSYVKFDQPANFNGIGEKKYSGILLFDKKETDMSEIEAAREAALASVFKGYPQKIYKGLDDPIRDGDDETLYPDKDEYRNC